MKAAVLHEVNKPLVIEDVSLPKPGPREVLIRTSVAGLCHSDLHFIEGLYPHPLPAVLGHESAGVVEQVGSDVTYVKPGDHVVTCLSVFCGTCDNCSTGRPVLCNDTSVKMLPGQSNRLSWARSEKLNQFLNLSSFAEQMLVHENAIVKIRKDMPLDLAALIGCGVVTGYGAVVNTAKVAPGETVVVIGCGGVGMAAINGAQIAGAGRVIAVDTNPAKLQLATKLGATDIVDPKNGDVVQQVRDLTGGGVHHSFEVFGPQGDRRAGVCDAGARRHLHHCRHDPVRPEDRAARLRFPAGTQDPGLLDGLEPFPRRHAPAGRLLHARQAASGRLDLGQAEIVGNQRRLCRDEGRQDGAQRDRV
jgi:S-(hydroxymethyl)glutathione dehydrogenase / alcohol dehydrogenase